MGCCAGLLGCFRIGLCSVADDFACLIAYAVGEGRLERKRRAEVVGIEGVEYFDLVGVI